MASTTGLKYGAWVFYGGRLGILTRTRYNEHFEQEEIHFVNRNRETVEIASYNPAVPMVYANLTDEEKLAGELAKMEE